jgi:hypothetical protein
MLAFSPNVGRRHYAITDTHSFLLVRNGGWVLVVREAESLAVVLHAKTDSRGEAIDMANEFDLDQGGTRASARCEKFVVALAEELS